jgi:ubiquinone/menaquinone biosynthesis C-methylase UbiE
VSSRQLLFNVMYQVGFAPWDGHGLAKSLQGLVEGESALPTGTALDVGCGTGDNSIYLANHGWRVTGVDFVAKALAKARAKASANKVDVRFAQANVTRLSAEGVGSNFSLIVDNGCLHGMSDDDRGAYVREVTAVAAPDARLLLVEFLPGERFGVPGIEPAEVERRFSADWTLLTTGDEPGIVDDGGKLPRYYMFTRGA